MTDLISNTIDFTEVFNAIRKEQREFIKDRIANLCFEQHDLQDSKLNLIVCEDHQNTIDLIDSLPLPGGEQT